MCTMQENFVPLQHSCKTDIRQRNCGIAKEKIFVSLGTIFSWPNRKTRTQGKGFKEEEIILQPLKFLIQLWH